MKHWDGPATEALILQQAVLARAADGAFFVLVSARSENAHGRIHLTIVRNGTDGRRFAIIVREYFLCRHRWLNRSTSGFVTCFFDTTIAWSAYRFEEAAGLRFAGAGFSNWEMS